MCECNCEGIKTKRKPCERCAEMSDCTDIVLPSRTVSLCDVCMASVERELLDFIEMFDPDASTVYVQLSRDEVRRLRDGASYGTIDPYVLLTPDQRSYIYQLLFDSNCSEWDLGLVDEPTE